MRKNDFDDYMLYKNITEGKLLDGNNKPYDYLRPLKLKIFIVVYVVLSFIAGWIS